MYKGFFQSILILVPLLAPLRAELKHDLAGVEIIDRYLVTQEVLSELVYVRMSHLEADGTAKHHQILAAFRYNEDASSNYLLRLIEPAEVKGVSFLIKQFVNGGLQQHLYLPSVGRARPLTGKSENQPFLGTNFTLADLQKEVPAVHAYERLSDTFVFGRDCFRVRAVEETEGAARLYSHRDLYVDKENYNLLKVDYFDTTGKNTKELALYDYQSPMINGFTKRPHRAVMKNLENGSTTVFAVIEARIDEAIGAEIFTPSNIETWTDEEIESFIFAYGLKQEPGR